MIFEEALKSVDNQKIMQAVCYRFRKMLDEDDAESLRMQALWECCDKYDPDHPKQTKFTSFLYQRLLNKIRNHLKKKRREKVGYVPEKSYMPRELEFDILNSLSTEDKNILTQSYLYNMTIEEIGKANGYSRETARRKLNKIKKRCVDLVST